MCMCMNLCYIWLKVRWYTKRHLITHTTGPCRRLSQHSGPSGPSSKSSNIARFIGIWPEGILSFITLYRLSKQKSKLLIQGLWWEHRLFHRAMRVVPITFKGPPVILWVKVPVFMFVLLFVWIKVWVCIPSLQKTARYITYLLHDAKDTAFDLSQKPSSESYNATGCIEIELHIVHVRSQLQGIKCTCKTS